MIKKTYNAPTMEIDLFVPNDYIAGCAQYTIKLTCIDPAESGRTSDMIETIFATKDNKLSGDHNVGWGGKCTTTISEFSSSETGGGAYQGDLMVGNTSLSYYADIRDYLSKKTPYSGTSVPTINDKYGVATWSTVNGNITYKHRGYLTFTKVTGESANLS